MLHKYEDLSPEVPFMPYKKATILCKGIADRASHSATRPKDQQFQRLLDAGSPKSVLKVGTPRGYSFTFLNFKFNKIRFIYIKE